MQMQNNRIRLLIAGGSGLIGSRMIELLDTDKYDIKVLSRKKRSNTTTITYHQWDFDTMTIDHDALDVDHIVNFTGAGIADGRWTESRKKAIIDSRVDSAKLILKGLKESGRKPKSYISASAIGYYGDRGDEILTEESKPGEGFMSDVCQLWEDSARLLQNFCDRLIINRIGVVLSTKGGALPKVLMTDKVKVYNYFGSGSQFYAWIHIDDVARIFIEAIENQHLSGIYNAVSPTPLTNRIFTQKVRDARGGGLVMPAPKLGLRLVLGEMANVVLNSTRVIPQSLTNTAFKFEHPVLESAVKDLIEREI